MARYSWTYRQCHPYFFISIPRAKSSVRVYWGDPPTSSRALERTRKLVPEQQQLCQVAAGEDDQDLPELQHACMSGTQSDHARHSNLH